MIYDLIVVGGGAAGMASAITAAKKLKENKTTVNILIIEKNKKMGKKLYATGNGRCNLSNSYLDLKCYNSENEFFPFEVISKYSYREVNDFFSSLGMEVNPEKGYFYPSSGQASTVVWALVDGLNELGVDIHVNEKVIDLCEEGELYQVISDKANYFTANLIMACGGAAAPELGGTLEGYELCENLGFSLFKPLPSLVKLKTKEKIEELFGVRCRAKATCYIDGLASGDSQGELQFNKDNISGIMIFNLSNICAKALENRKKVTVSIELLPELSIYQVESFIKNFVLKCGNRRVNACLNGLLNEKIAGYIINLKGLSNCLSKDLSKDDIEALAKLIKNLEFNITDTGSFKDAQVSSGGVDTRLIDPLTMKSRFKKNLYVVGETLDVDGICGGYNIMWAVITGIRAGRSITNDTNK